MINNCTGRLVRYLFVIILCLVPLCVLAKSHFSIRYAALGDSYTIGTGSSPDESWPAVVTQRLQKKGIPIELIANLGREGWTTQNLIDYQLPVLKKIHPDFVTVLIGVNDWVQGVDAAVFREHFRFILDKILEGLPDPKALLVVTIPDFSVMPAGSQFAAGRNIAKGIVEFNQIIKKEAESHGVGLVDLYPLSQTMGKDLSLSATDGVHPSAKGYALWADLIEPAFNFENTQRKRKQELK